MLMLSIASPGSGTYGKKARIARSRSSKAKRARTIVVAMAWRRVIRGPIELERDCFYASTSFGRRQRPGWDTGISLVVPDDLLTLWAEIALNS